MNGSVLFEGSQLLSGSLNVNTGGNIEPLEIEINENGTREITPPSGVDGYAPITIETIVPQIAPILETLNVTQNGRYEPPEGVAGFDEVNVEVLHPLDTLNVTENGSYEPPTGVYGFSHVNVNVPTPTPVYRKLLVNENGTYTPPTGVDGFNEIIVNVPTFPYYDFHATEDGKIVVRRKFYLENNEVKIETLWFFNGYYFANNLVDIPTNLLQFTKINTDISGKTYTDDTSSTQNGWVAVSTAYYQNKLVCYTTGWQTDANKYVWAVLNNDGGTNQTLEWFDPYDV